MALNPNRKTSAGGVEPSAAYESHLNDFASKLTGKKNPDWSHLNLLVEELLHAVKWSLPHEAKTYTRDLLIEIGKAKRKYHDDALEHAHHALFISSVTILGIFMMEFVILIGVLGLSFFRNVVYLVDFVVGRICDQLGVEVELTRRWGHPDAPPDTTVS